MTSYDQMQVCLNGHRITDQARTSPQFRRKFCSSCGAPTIDACPSCNFPIRGNYLDSAVIIVGYSTPVPRYCENCGEPYPWRQAAIENLKEVLREGELSDADLSALEAALPDVLRDTPKTESAALRVNRLIKGLGKPAYDIAIKVLTDVMTASAKKAMGL